MKDQSVCRKVFPYCENNSGKGYWLRLTVGHVSISVLGKSTQLDCKMSSVISHHERRHPCPLCENLEFDTTVMKSIMECHKPDLNLEQNWTMGKLMKAHR